MPQEHGLVLSKVLQNRQDISTEVVQSVGFHGLRPAAAPIATHIQCHRSIACTGKGWHLVAPAIPEPGVTVTHYHQWPVTLTGKVERNPVGF
jgi:hypothetical protein